MLCCCLCHRCCCCFTPPWPPSLLLLLQGDVLGIIMRRHDALCGLLVGELSKIKGHAATADAQLTVLANWIEDQVRHSDRVLHGLRRVQQGGVRHSDMVLHGWRRVQQGQVATVTGYARTAQGSAGPGVPQRQGLPLRCRVQQGRVGQHGPAGVQIQGSGWAGDPVGS